MPNANAVAALAANLGHLQHPSGSLVAIPGFDRHALNHPELGEVHGKYATEIAEAAVHTIEVNGVECIDKGVLNARIADAAAELNAGSEVMVRCHRCRQKVFRLDTSNHDGVTANVGMLAQALAQHGEECR